MKLLILSDIHGNQFALQAVLSKAKGNYDEVLLLGDLIDYGPHSNEVIEMLQELSKTVPIRCNIT
ncbi:MAG: metallophosphoesterase, partial [Lachnospiraceae bacterium]|nr:metallophosphoesterase [Lachnospiraceae bacterium]